LKKTGLRAGFFLLRKKISSAFGELTSGKKDDNLLFEGSLCEGHFLPLRVKGFYHRDKTRQGNE